MILTRSMVSKQNAPLYELDFSKPRNNNRYLRIRNESKKRLSIKCVLNIATGICFGFILMQWLHPFG